MARPTRQEPEKESVFWSLASGEQFGREQRCAEFRLPKGTISSIPAKPTIMLLEKAKFILREWYHRFYSYSIEYP